jgi:hypothetical protein
MPSVVMSLEIDVVIEGDAALLPLGEDVGLGRKSLHRWPIEGLKDSASRAR